jgi:hypothetical protein
MTHRRGESSGVPEQTARPGELHHAASPTSDSAPRAGGRGQRARSCAAGDPGVASAPSPRPRPEGDSRQSRTDPSGAHTLAGFGAAEPARHRYSAAERYAVQAREPQRTSTLLSAETRLRPADPGCAFQPLWRDTCSCTVGPSSVSVGAVRATVRAAGRPGHEH